jgi:hypothetical protein
MALLTTIADLKAAVADWLNRSGLTGPIDNFLALGDARVRRDQRWDRRIYSVENGGAFVAITGQGQALPAGVQIVRDVWPSTGSFLGALAQTSIAGLRDLANTNGDVAGIPRKFAILPAPDPTVAGARIFFWPAPPAGYAIDLIYVHDVGKLTTPENRLFIYAPDVYLWAALAESAPYLKHDERVPLWEQKYGAALNALNTQADEAAHGASRAHVKLRQAF